MKIYALKCMHLLRVASQCQNSFYGERVVWVKWLSLAKDEGHVIPKHSHHDIPSQQPCVHKIFTTYAKCHIQFSYWQSPFREVLPKIGVDPKLVDDHTFKPHWPTTWIWNDGGICFSYPNNYITWWPFWAKRKMFFKNHLNLQFGT